MVEGVLELDDLVAADVMTQKNQIVWIDLDEPDPANRRRMIESGHTHFPAYRDTRDNVLGMISVKTLWAETQQGTPRPLEALVTEPLFVSETMPCPRIIEEFRRQRRHLALVVDEFGGVAGLVTLHDLMESVLGDMPDAEQRELPKARQLADGSWLVDALLEIEDAADQIGFALPKEEIDEGLYRTLSGFLLHRFGHVPREGQKLVHDGCEFEVADLDRRRIDKVAIRRNATAPVSEPAA
jgi:putative hemolysin